LKGPDPGTVVVVTGDAWDRAGGPVAGVVVVAGTVTGDP
jgi:hypothetical protein